MPTLIRSLLLVAALLSTVEAAWAQADSAALRFEAVAVETEAEMWWARVPGDVNGDGLVDVFVQNNNASGGWLGWYEASDEGRTWTRHVIAERAPNDSLFAAGDLDAGDIDGDGDVDVLGIQHTGEWDDADAPAHIYWYENRLSEEDSAWAPHAIGEVPDAVKDVNLADLNADGLLDLAVMTFEENTMSVFRQDGPGDWAPVQRLTVENLHEGMDACDLDGDGDLDLAANGYWLDNPGGDLAGTWDVRSIDERWHTQTGDWSRNATKVFCRDMTGDGRPEVFMTHSERSGYPVAWYEAPTEKGGDWTMHTVADSLPAAHTLQVYDMDGDGDQDVVTGVNKNRAVNLGIEEAFPVVVYLNGGDAETWTPHLITEAGIYNGQVVDLEGDGDYDLFRLETHDGERFEVLVNQMER